MKKFLCFLILSAGMFVSAGIFANTVDYGPSIYQTDSYCQSSVASDFDYFANVDYTVFTIDLDGNNIIINDSNEHFKTSDKHFKTVEQTSIPEMVIICDDFVSCFYFSTNYLNLTNNDFAYYFDFNWNLKY